MHSEKEKLSLTSNSHHVLSDSCLNPPISPCPALSAQYSPTVHYTDTIELY